MVGGRGLDVVEHLKLNLKFCASACSIKLLLSLENGLQKDLDKVYLFTKADPPSILLWYDQTDTSLKSDIFTRRFQGGESHHIKE